MIRIVSFVYSSNMLVTMLIVGSTVSTVASPADRTPLTHVHLRVISAPMPPVTEIKANATGHFISIKGVFPEVMEWLSQHYHFTYSYLQQAAYHTADTALGRGTMSYLLSGEADVILLTPATALYSKQVDYTMPAVVDAVCFLIPYPIASISASNIVNPFDFVVWLCILLSMPMVIFALWGIVRLHSKVTNNTADFSLRRAFHYAFCVILSQGDEISYRNTTVQLAAGAWCLACFVLVTAYNSVLTSCILAPEVHPIINSIHDLAGSDHSSLRLLVEKGSTFAAVYFAAKDGIYKEIGDNLRSNSDLLCKNKRDCLAQVIAGNNDRCFVETSMTLKGLMIQDFKETGKCRFTIAKQPSNYPKVGLALAKNSPYRAYFDKGIMQMWENGLLNAWIEKYVPQPRQCLKTDQTVKGNPPLSLKYLSGAFTLLLIGHSLAIMVFIMETIVHRCSKRNR